MPAEGRVMQPAGPAGASDLRWRPLVAVTWYPRRSAAEHVDPRRYNAVTVTAPRRYGSAHLVTRTFTARRIITRLARLVSACRPCPTS